MFREEIEIIQKLEKRNQELQQELEQTVKQYDAVVEQNKSLQRELNSMKKMFI